MPGGGIVNITIDEVHEAVIPGIGYEVMLPIFRGLRIRERIPGSHIGLIQRDILRPGERQRFVGAISLRAEAGRIENETIDGSNFPTIVIEKVEPERYFSYRWHPYAIDPKTDYSSEPTTLVEFLLEEVEGGTALTIVESGFDRIPLARRAEAYRMDDQGWTGQIKAIAKYVEKP